MTERLDLASVELRGRPLVLVTDAEVDDLEARLDVRMPDGYREYVTTLGEGSLNDFVRVLPPWRILAELDEHRGRMAAGWYWRSGNVAFGQDEAMGSIPIADTLDGDVILFSPADTRQLIVLPREHERVYARGPNLLETINWVCSGRVLRSFGPQRYFEPFNSRLEESHPGAEESGAESVATPPDLTGPPRDVLMAYFAELRAVEEWALAGSGGLEALRMDDPPLPDDEWSDELLVRSAAVHSRYCSRTLANALSGASVTISWPLEHDPSVIRVLDEREMGPGRVAIRTAEGKDGFQHEYVLERSRAEWRIKAQKHL